MNRFIALLFVGTITFLAVLYVKRPDVLNNIWMWIVGLALPIAGLLKRIYLEVKERLNKDKAASTSQNIAKKPTL